MMSRAPTANPPSAASIPPAREPDAPFPLRHPDGTRIAGPRTVAAGVAIASAVFARAGAPPPEDRLAYLGAELEDFLARSGPRARGMLSLMIWIVAIVAPLLLGKLGTLRALGHADRVRALDQLERRFGEPLIAVKAILCLIYYEHPAAALEVGFDGQCLAPRSRP
jgi:hypothetical protein